MPLIQVKLIEEVFSPVQKKEIISRLSINIRVASPFVACFDESAPR